jgi:hypothetical protein
MARFTRYSINYVTRFESDLRQVGGFLQVHQFPPAKKLIAMHEINEILLKVALNTIRGGSRICG